MSDDPDLSKTTHALQMLRQARLSRNVFAALKLSDPVHETAGIGLETPEVEETDHVALVAISALFEPQGFARQAMETCTGDRVRTVTWCL
jgi:hypothetical protein